MSDIPHFVAWIDYLIASTDAADQALATEYRAQDCAMRELVKAATAEWKLGSIDEGWTEKVAAQQRICDELTKRVYARAQTLMAEGAPPADEATVARDWRARATGVQRDTWPNNDDENPSATVN